MLHLWHWLIKATNEHGSTDTSFIISVPLDLYPEMELLGHTVVLFLIFWRSSLLLFIMAAPTCIPTKSGQEFPFLSASSLTLVSLVFVCVFFNWRILDLHCCVNFSKVIQFYIHAHKHTLSLIFLPLWCTTGWTSSLCYSTVGPCGSSNSGVFWQQPF